MSKLKSRLIKRIRTAGERNAIERLIFGFEWDQQLNQSALTHLSLIAQEIPEFPRCIEIRASEQAIDDDQSDLATLKNSTDIVQIVADDSESSEVLNTEKSKELQIRKNGFVFQRTDTAKSNWAEIKKQTLETSNTIITELLKLTPLKSVGLKIIRTINFDRELGLEEILNTKGSLIPPSIFTGASYWRFEHSFYEPPTSKDAVQVAFYLQHAPADNNEDKLIISCLHRLFYSDPEPSSSEILSQEYDSLYSMNKLLVSKLLNPDTADLIGINPDGDGHAI